MQRWLIGPPWCSGGRSTRSSSRRSSSTWRLVKGGPGKGRPMTDQTDTRWLDRRYSLETRAKMSAAAKRRVRAPHSPETCAKISVAMSAKRGPHSAEHCAKISAGKRASRRTAEQIAKLAAAKRGRALPAEHRAKIAAAARERARRKTEERRADYRLNAHMQNGQRVIGQRARAEDERRRLSADRGRGLR
jgi:hypothetical protein